MIRCTNASLYTLCVWLRNGRQPPHARCKAISSVIDHSLNPLNGQRCERKREGDLLQCAKNMLQDCDAMY